MLTNPQSHADTQASLAASAAQPETDIVYHEPASVFAHWYNKYRTQFPCQRPPLKWLAAHSLLPLATCHYYRKRMEQTFPDAYAVTSTGKNLRLSKNRYKRRLKPVVSA